MLNLVSSAESFALSLLWASVALYWWGTLRVQSQGEISNSKLLSPSGPIARLGYPLVHSLGPSFERLGGGTTLRHLLIQGDVPLSVGEFRASRFLTTLAFLTVGWLFDSSLDSSPLLTLIFGALGVVYPDIYLSGLITRRKRQIFRDLPDILDIIRIAVAAGLDLTSALRVVVGVVAQGPLAREFGIVERDIALGRTRAEALEAMAARVNLNEFNAFVMAIRQADELGAPVGPILGVQSEMARQKRYQLAETLIGKLPTKLLGPLVLCIFPASFIVLFTPLILDYLESGF